MRGENWQLSEPVHPTKEKRNIFNYADGNKNYDYSSYN